MVARPALPNLDTLPPEALKALLHAQHQTLTVQAERIQVQDEQLAGRQAEIERLQLLIAKLRADAVRAPVGEVARADRAIGATTGRTGHRVGGAPGGFPYAGGDGTRGSWPQAGAAAAAGSSAAREADDSAQGNGLSGLRRRVESLWAKMSPRSWSTFRPTST